MSGMVSIPGCSSIDWCPQHTPGRFVAPCILGNLGYNGCRCETGDDADDVAGMFDEENLYSEIRRDRLVALASEIEPSDLELRAEAEEAVPMRLLAMYRAAHIGHGAVFR